MLRNRLKNLLGACLAAAIAGCAGTGLSTTGGGSSAVPSTQRGAQNRADALSLPAVTAPSCATKAAGTNSFIGSKLEGNVAHGEAAGILSGKGNQVCDGFSGVVSGQFNLISGSGGSAFIGGGNSNLITGGSLRAASGIVAGFTNRISGESSFLGAGQQNSVDGNDSSIGAGTLNVVSSDESAIDGGDRNNVSGIYGFIGAGNANSLSGSAGAIGGGASNQVTSSYGTVSGGDSNRAGEYAAVPGGAGNIASGELSFAAGHDSFAAASGSFVWSDFATGAKQLEASTANRFLARASGGFVFYTNAANTVGATLGAGSGTWASLSDRHAKTNLSTIDDARVLDKVATLPVGEWSYRSEPGVRHLGPMAQDFYAAFAVGEDNRHITSIDEEGVALAAIKALHQQVRTLQRDAAQKDAALQTLQRKIEQLTTEVGAIRSR